MVAGLFEEIEQVFARDVFEEQEEEVGGLPGAVEGDDIGMRGQGLVDSDLGHLKGEGIIVEVCLGETLEGVFAAIDWGGGRRGKRASVEIHGTNGGHAVAII